LDPSNLTDLAEWQWLARLWKAELATAIEKAIEAESFEMKEYQRGIIETFRLVLSSPESLEGIG